MTTTQTPRGNMQNVTNKQENQRKLGTIPGIFKGNGNVSPLERWASGVGGVVCSPFTVSLGAIGQGQHSHSLAAVLCIAA
jgi:hypothetical protein